jgi:hypothetical protein
MGLNWRAVFETDDTSVFDRAPAILRDWGSFKTRDPDFALPPPNAPVDETDPIQFRVETASADNAEVWRTTCFQRRWGSCEEL